MLQQHSRTFGPLNAYAYKLSHAPVTIPAVQNTLTCKTRFMRRRPAVAVTPPPRRVRAVRHAGT